jgi:hypothetical protein
VLQFENDGSLLLVALLIFIKVMDGRTGDVPFSQ